MLSIEVKGVDAIVADFADASPRAMKASVRSINRAITSGRAFLARAMARDLGLKIVDVKAAIRFDKASFEHPEARLAASLKQIPLSKFKFHGPRPSRGRGTGVTVQLPSGTARYPHAFIAKLKAQFDSGVRLNVRLLSSAREGVFVRVAGSTKRSKHGWSKNLPIKQLYGPSLGLVFQQHRPAAITHMIAAFEKNFAHEFEFARSQDAGAS